MLRAHGITGGRRREHKRRRRSRDPGLRGCSAWLPSVLCVVIVSVSIRCDRIAPRSCWSRIAEGGLAVGIGRCRAAGVDGARDGESHHHGRHRMAGCVLDRRGHAVLGTDRVCVCGRRQGERCRWARGGELGHEGVGVAVGRRVERARGRREAYVREAGHVGAAGDVERDAEALGKTSVPKEGGVDEGSPGGVQLRHEGAEPAAEQGGLESVSCRREVGRACKTRHVGVADGVHRDAAGRVKITTPAEEGGVPQGAPGRIQLRHEGVGPCAECSLERVRGRREVRRRRLAGHVGIT